MAAIVRPVGSSSNPSAGTVDNIPSAPAGAVYQPLRAGAYFYASSAEDNFSTPLSVGTLRLAPWFVAGTVRLDQMFAEIAGVGGTGAQLRLGIYSDSGDGRPVNLVVDAGTVDATTTGVKTSNIDVTLTSGLYWIGGVVQNVTTPLPTVRLGRPLTPVCAALGTMPPAQTTTLGALVTGVTGALPAQIATVPGNAGAIPLVGVRVVWATDPNKADPVIFDANYARLGTTAYRFVAHPEDVSVVEDPAPGSSRPVLKVVCGDDNVGTNGLNRTQLETPYVFRENEELYVGFSLYLPADYPAVLPPKNDIVNSYWPSGYTSPYGTMFWDVYGPPSAGTGPVCLGTRVTHPGELILYTNPDNQNVDWHGPYVREQWMDFVVRIRMGAAGNGWIEMWRNNGAGWQEQTFSNGLKRLPRATLDATNNAGPNMSTVRVYHFTGAFDNPVTAYFGEHKVGFSFASAAPRSYS